MSQWNAYYDVYVKWAALILVFMVACNYVTDSHVWLHLKTGQLIAKQAAPVTTDQFSYTEAGRPWFNIPWLFQWFHAFLYDFVYGLVPVDKTDPTANQAKAEQIAIGTLVVFDALVRFLTAGLILKFRHRGPGLWWSAVCMTLALGVIYHPIVGILMGGIAGPSFVSPSTWGLFLLALELWILFRAFFQGRGFGLWLLVPIFLLWVNVDESFLFGLAVLAASALGYVIDRGRTDALLERPGEVGEADADVDREKSAGIKLERPGEVGAADADVDREKSAGIKPVGHAIPLVITGLCVLVCLANPSTWHAFELAVSPFFHLFQPSGKITTVDQLSFLSSELRRQMGDDWLMLLAYFLGVVSVGLGSFLLNIRKVLVDAILAVCGDGGAVAIGDARECGFFGCFGLGAGAQRPGMVPGSIWHTGADGWSVGGLVHRRPHGDPCADFPDDEQRHHGLGEFVARHPVRAGISPGFVRARSG